VQVVIALVVTPEGLPLAYEVMAGNTRDKATLRGFLARIEDQYGKGRRTWVMDRGIPTEEVLQETRVRSTGAVPGRHAEGPSHPIREAIVGEAMA
jgi:transposase